MDAKVYFSKVKEGAKIPSKRDEDAAFDIYACFDEPYIIIDPHETKMIPTGIASACSKNFCFILKERGSTGSKGIAQRCGVIDSGYRGEWFVPVTNTTDCTIAITKKGKELELQKSCLQVGILCKIYPAEKAICQALVVPVPRVVVEEVQFDELNKMTSERGVGALGSSGK